jgi:hypothetical protein
MEDGSNIQKTPLAFTLPQAIKSRAADATWVLGKTMLCTVQTVNNPWNVTVTPACTARPGTLQPMTVPVMAPPYIAYPIQVGDAGIVIQTGMRLGSLSGAGGGTPDLADTVGNLATGAFFWLGNSAWTSLDAEALVLWGNVVVGQSKLAFFGGPKVSKPDVVGALSAVTDPAAKAVLTSLIMALAGGQLNLIENGTS